VPTPRITLSAIQPAVRGVMLSASGGHAAPLVLWLPTERADFKSQRSSAMLTHAACTIDGREAHGSQAGRWTTFAGSRNRMPEARISTFIRLAEMPLREIRAWTARQPSRWRAKEVGLPSRSLPKQPAFARWASARQPSLASLR
jgi:hypothetical protein